ncbi:MAG: tetratricopeptide repeat protein [Bacteroidota bacterium]
MRKFQKTSCLLLALLAMSFFSVAQRDKKKKPDAEHSTAARLREAEFFFTEGQKYFILEDYSKALTYFQRTLELNPQNATVHYKIAEILSKGNKEEDLRSALNAIETALRLEKKNKYFYLLAANIYGSLLQFEKAEETMEAMLREVRGTEEYLYELAAFYLYDNKPNQALEVYNRAETLLGINEVSSLQKQRIYFEQGKTEEAIREGEKLIEAFPDEERYVLGLAETLSQNKQGARAISYIETYLAAHPEAGSARLLLASLYRENGQESRARELLLMLFDDASVEAGSKILVVGTYNALLNQLANSPQVDPDLGNFIRQLVGKLKANYPDNPNVYIVSGDLQMALKDMRGAQAEYLQAVRKGSSSFDAWQNLLYLESQLNQFDSLIEHTEEALELFPNQALLYYFNGYAHLRQRQYREATYALEQAKKMAASNATLLADINGLLGDAYNGAHDYAKSDKAYDEALALNPNNDLILNNYSYYLALRNENLEKAEKMSAQLVKNNPDNSAFLDTHAWVLFMREKYKEARKFMERAIATGETSATHFEHYGDILFKLGEVDEAVVQWQKAKQMDGDNVALDKKIANRKLY